MLISKQIHVGTVALHGYRTNVRYGLCLPSVHKFHWPTSVNHPVSEIRTDRTRSPQREGRFRLRRTCTVGYTCSIHSSFPSRGGIRSTWARSELSIEIFSPLTLAEGFSFRWLCCQKGVTVDVDFDVRHMTIAVLQNLAHINVAKLFASRKSTAILRFNWRKKMAWRIATHFNRQKGVVACVMAPGNEKAQRAQNFLPHHIFAVTFLMGCDWRCQQTLDNTSYNHHTTYPHPTIY